MGSWNIRHDRRSRGLHLNPLSKLTNCQCSLNTWALKSNSFDITFFLYVYFLLRHRKSNSKMPLRRGAIYCNWWTTNRSFLGWPNLQWQLWASWRHKFYSYFTNYIWYRRPACYLLCLGSFWKHCTMLHSDHGYWYVNKDFCIQTTTLLYSSVYEGQLIR